MTGFKGKTDVTSANSAAARAPARAAAVSLWLFALSLTAPNAAALQRDAPRFSGFEELPAAGFVVPSMDGARQIPAKPVETVRYLCTLGDRQWEEERANMNELWRAAQRLAAWRDRAGNEIVFARVICSIPPALAGLDVTRDTFEEAIENPDLALGPESDPDMLALWAADFAGIHVDAAPERNVIPVNTSRFAKTVAVSLPDPALRVFLTRLNPHFPGHARAPRSWWAFFVRFATAPQPGDLDSDRMLRTDFVGALRTVGWKESEKAQAALSKRRTWSGADPRDIPDDPDRAAARESVAHLDDWWYMESPHYIVLSDDPAAERSADRLLGTLEALLPHYEALVPAFRGRGPGTGVVRIFRKSSDFDAYFENEGVPLGLSSTVGLFSPARRELVIRPPDKHSAQDLASVVRHEAFHQYLHSVWGGAATSPWFNEGTAELFASCAPKGNGGFDFRELSWHARTLEKLARDRDVDWNGLVRAVLFWDYDQFYRPPVSGANASLSYAMAYGISCFLHRGAPLMRSRPYRDVLPTYFETLEKTGSPGAATAAAFDLGRDGRRTQLLDKFCDDLRAFWKNESARRQSQRAKVP